MREESTLEGDINKIFKDIEEIKTAQYITGDVWNFYRIHVPAITDYDVNITGLLINVTRAYRFTFIPDDPDVVTAVQWLTRTDNANVGFQTSVIPTQGVDHSIDFALKPNGGTLNIDIAVQALSTQNGTYTITQIV